MKIQAHPGLWAMPFIFMIAAASRPENAPEREADAKNVEILQEKYCEEIRKGFLEMKAGTGSEAFVGDRRMTDKGQVQGTDRLCESQYQ